MCRYACRYVLDLGMYVVCIGCRYVHRYVLDAGMYVVCVGCRYILDVDMYVRMRWM